jgi:predicted small metal-binding protein
VSRGCSREPGGTDRDRSSPARCTLTIAGEEDEVVAAATQHAVSVHGHQDNAELRQMVRDGLKDEVSV